MEDQEVERNLDSLGDFLDSDLSETPWTNRFWVNPGGEDTGFPSPRCTPTRTVRRPSPTHRVVHHPRRNPRRWSYTNGAYFDKDTVRLLVGWAVRWIRGNGLPLGYKDPYASEYAPPGSPNR